MDNPVGTGRVIYAIAMTGKRMGAMRARHHLVDKGLRHPYAACAFD
jgi:hypothetical protein